MSLIEKRLKADLDVLATVVRTGRFPPEHHEWTDDAYRRAAKLASERFSELGEARRRADQKHSTIAKAVFETVQDKAARWEDACDFLIWEDPQCDRSLSAGVMKVTAAHLAVACARFPQYAEQLRDFSKLWNEEEPLTDEICAAAEVQVSEKQLERTTAGVLRILRFYQKLSAVERIRDGAVSLLTEGAIGFGRILVATENQKQVYDWARKSKAFLRDIPADQKPQRPREGGS